MSAEVLKDQLENADGSRVDPSRPGVIGLSREQWFWGGALVVVALVASMTYLFALVGVKSYFVETPSMGSAAPVGSLVLVREAKFVGEGDIITFRPPERESVYTHRVVAVTDAGYQTQGDVNAAADPWVVPHDRVVGRVTGVLWGVGWLLRMLPWFLLGCALAFLVTLRIRDVGRKWQYRLVGMSLSWTLAGAIVQPYLRSAMMGWAPAKGGGADVAVTNTGVLPIRAYAVGGESVVLDPGEVGTVMTRALDHNGFFHVEPHLGLYGWWWVAVIGFCLLPVLYAALIGFPLGEGQAGVGVDDDEDWRVG